MTAPRQTEKFGDRRWALLGALAIAGAWALPAWATTTEQIVVDRYSGLAINGFDPVAYFIDGAPLLGRADIECAFAGAIWRFHNEGNRAAFMADPEAYMPSFGGYDPIGIVRGVAVPGNPRLWLIKGRRLYLFYAPEARERFGGDPEDIAASAEKEWPAVRATLSP